MGTNITARTAESTGLVNNQNSCVMSHKRTKIQSAENKCTGIRMHVHALFLYCINIEADDIEIYMFYKHYAYNMQIKQGHTLQSATL